jgi:ubiquinone/menaquinone biosynthesis C-methylase UbiE
MFDGLAPSYDQSGVPFFGPIAEGLVRRLRPAPGERVLDLGSGRGAATIPLAEAVGPSGSVTAVDVSAQMVELLTATLAERSATNVTVSRGDATTPPAGPFDVVCASLVLFFLPDPVAALSAWRGTLADGGRVGISSFAPWSPSMEAATDVLDSYRSADAESPAPMPEAFRTDEAVEDLFRVAGFDRVRTVRATYEIPYRDVEQWRAWSLGTALRGLWTHVPDEAVPEAMERLDAVLQERGHRLEVDIRYTLART